MMDDLEFDLKPRVRNTAKSFSVKKMIVNEGEFAGQPFFIASFEVEDKVFEFVMMAEEVKRIEETCHMIISGVDIDNDLLPPITERDQPKEFFPDL